MTQDPGKNSLLPPVRAAYCNISSLVFWKPPGTLPGSTEYSYMSRSPYWRSLFNFSCPAMSEMRETAGEDEQPPSHLTKSNDDDQAAEHTWAPEFVAVSARMTTHFQQGPRVNGSWQCQERALPGQNRQKLPFGP